MHSNVVDDICDEAEERIRYKRQFKEMSKDIDDEGREISL